MQSSSCRDLLLRPPVQRDTVALAIGKARQVLDKDDFPGLLEAGKPAFEPAPELFAAQFVALPHDDILRRA